MHQTLQEEFTLQRLAFLQEQNNSLRVRIQNYEDLLQEALSELKALTEPQEEG